MRVRKEIIESAESMRTSNWEWALLEVCLDIRDLLKNSQRENGNKT